MENNGISGMRAGENCLWITYVRAIGITLPDALPDTSDST